MALNVKHWQNFAKNSSGTWSFLVCWGT